MEHLNTQEGKEAMSSFEDSKLALESFLDLMNSSDQVPSEGDITSVDGLRQEFSTLEHNGELGHERIRLEEKFSAEELDALPEYWQFLGKEAPATEIKLSEERRAEILSALVNKIDNNDHMSMLRKYEGEYPEIAQ